MLGIVTFSQTTYAYPLRRRTLQSQNSRSADDLLTTTLTTSNVIVNILDVLHKSVTMSIGNESDAILLARAFYSKSWNQRIIKNLAAPISLPISTH